MWGGGGDVRPGTLALYAIGLAGCSGGQSRDHETGTQHDGACGDGVDEALFHVDADNDSYGGPDTVLACESDPGVADNADDCDDDDSTVRPGAPELCNGRDDDCDGVLDTDLSWYVD